MIKKEFLIPECYIHKQAYCDDCGELLIDTGNQLLSSPPKTVMKCNKCNKFYHINVEELQGEWKWRTT